LALLTGAFVAATVGRGLSPLARLEAGAATIDAERLDRRLPTSGQPREVASLSTKLNELLARLQGAFERERRMTANIAHELRTPVSELKVSCELADRWPEDPELAASLQETARAVSNRMERIVDGLMHLARVESGREALVNHRTDLQDLVQQAWSDLNSVTAARRVSLLSEGTAVIVATDRHLCGLVITGLVENAARHAIEGSTVLSEMASGRESVVWSLSNEAQGLVVADLDRLVEPFWCKDSARTDQDSTGLGLALAEAIVRRLGGRLEFSLEGHNFRVRLHLPATTRRHGEVENRADAAANRETLGRPVTLP
ncbi:MAG: HAMP domain-containing protein, partial [Planctomycetes bacterium]|nr:HAMP domain-containing protein [Planctomycetota bacterium]